MGNDLLIVISKIKKHIKMTTGCSISMEALGVLNNMVIEICENSAKKTLGERRKTIKPTDIVYKW